MKSAINKLLSETLLNNDSALSAWMGGSAATAREDEFSDTDLVVIASRPEAVFAVIEEALNTYFGIDQTWVVEDSFKYFQRFYTIKDSPQTYYLDIVIFDDKDPNLFREYFNKERHGSPVILFDKTEILKKTALHPTKEEPALNIENFKARFEIMYRTMLKEYLRGKYIDTYAFYMRLLSLYIQMERFIHSPQKHDFGLRYISIDLPSDSALFIEEMLKVSDLEKLKSNADLIKQRIKSYENTRHWRNTFLW